MYSISWGDCVPAPHLKELLDITYNIDDEESTLKYDISSL